MEKNMNDDLSSKKGYMLNELVEGRDLTRELQLNLSKEPYSSSNEAYGLIAKKILAKFERSLQLLEYDPIKEIQFQRIRTADSPSSFSGSPKSQDSEGDFKDLVEHKDDSRKRRISPRVTQRVQGCTSSGLEGPIEDGYNWRKYGQKDILGAKFPRAYYRCTFRTLQGCIATKQVQRSDDDPSFFEVTYRSKHTCSQASSPPSSSIPTNNPTPKLEPIETSPYSPNYPQKIMWDFKRDTKLITNDPIITTHLTPQSSFCFSSSSNPLLNDTQTTMLSYCDDFVGHGNFVTNTSSYTYQSPTSLMINENSFNNDHNYEDIAMDYQQGSSIMQEVVHTSSTSATNDSPEISFDQQGHFFN